MFEKNKKYLIDNKPFIYNGKIRDREFHQFTSIDNPEDVREISIFLGRYLYDIQRNEVE